MEWILPSNISPTIWAFVSMSGLPELPPTMSLLVDRSKRVCRLSVSFTFSQRVRDPEGLLAGGALEQARQVREGGHLLSLLVPALHGAEIQPQREVGIRRLTGAEYLEAGARDIFGSGIDRCLDLILVALAHGA